MTMAMFANNLNKQEVSMIRFPTRPWSRLCLAQLSLIFFVGVAGAQTTQTMPMEQVRDCLCQKQQLDAVSSRVSASGTAYSQRQQELQNAEQQLAELQRTAVPGDEQAVVQSQTLIDRRNLLRSQLRSEYAPYQSLLGDYNQRVERYNATCTTLPMLSFDVTAAKENLSCPTP